MRTDLIDETILITICIITISIVSFYLGIKYSEETAISEPTCAVEEVIIPNESTPITTDTIDDGLTIYDIPLSEDLQLHVYKVCAKYKIPASLVFAIIEVESNFKSDVISSSDCYGLMQVSTVHAKKLSKVFGSVDLLNPYQNIEAGVYLLSECLDGAESTAHALLRYNNGISGGDKLWAKGIYETEYTNKVLDAYDYYTIALQM